MIEAAVGGTRLQVDCRLIERLVPFARNARTHSDAQVAEAAAEPWQYPHSIASGAGQCRSVRLETV